MRGVYAEGGGLDGFALEIPMEAAVQAEVDGEAFGPPVLCSGIVTVSCPLAAGDVVVEKALAVAREAGLSLTIDAGIVPFVWALVSDGLGG